LTASSSFMPATPSSASTDFDPARHQHRLRDGHHAGRHRSAPVKAIVAGSRGAPPGEAHPRPDSPSRRHNGHHAGRAAAPARRPSATRHVSPSPSERAHSRWTREVRSRGGRRLPSARSTMPSVTEPWAPAAARWWGA
jgi:hypothetical protein